MPGYTPYPDDDTPLTRQWLTSRPWLEPQGWPGARLWLWHDAAGRLAMWLTDEMNGLGQGWWTYIGRELSGGTLWVPSVRTRGDLRRLLVALTPPPADPSAVAASG